jgi:type II secretion system protein G
MNINKIKTKKNLQSGFTLIEILVVMVIIGIIATIGFGSFQSSQTKGRDASRKSDLDQIGKALETYYNDKGQYPTDTGGLINGCSSGSACDWGDPFTDENGTNYMIEVPADPRSARNYYYSSTDGTSFQIYARLENELDKGIPVDVSDNKQEYSGLDCGGGNCNYGISSPNTTPGTGRGLVAI